MPDFDTVDWNLIADIKASERRSQVLEALCESPRTNSELSEQLGISTKWARDQVKWLQRRGLAEELSDKPNYKLYQATEKGEQIAEEVL